MERLLKILLVHNRYGAYSGEEAAVDRLEATLLRHGHEVRRYERDSATLGSRSSVARAFFSSLYSPRARRDMGRLLDEFRPDIVHVHNLYPLISPAILPLIREQGTPLVMTVHNFRLICPTGLFYSHGEVCERCSGGREYWCALRDCTGQRGKSLAYALRNAWARLRGHYAKTVDRFVCLTAFQCQRLDDGSGRFVVLRNSADDVDGDEDTLGGLGDYVGFVGRLTREKGVETLAGLCRRLPDIPFVFAGVHDDRTARLFDGLENVTLLGHQPADTLPDFYRRARLMVLPSLCYEGSPLALMEAMQQARPVVCSAVGGLSEIVDDGVTGLLASAGDVDDFSRRVEQLWRDPALCRRLGEAGRDKARREYSDQAHYQGLMRIYADARRRAAGG